MNSSAAGLIAHGGAGTWSEKTHPDLRKGLTEAARRGRKLLSDDRSALDVAVALVAHLEDDPTFNAGTGSVPNLDGDIQMDAAVMDGVTREAGAVANLRSVRHPIRVARCVMEETPHVLLGGEGARRFARSVGFEAHDPLTDRARERHRRRVEALRADEPDPDEAAHAQLRRLLEKHPDLIGGTVGAVVRDHRGRLAAATSTGGLSLQMVGRIGDTPLPGAGTWAGPRAAASATGRGELIMRSLATRGVCDRIESGEPPKEALGTTLRHMQNTVGNHAGIIAVDREGRLAADHGTPHMPHVRLRSDDGAPDYALTASDPVR